LVLAHSTALSVLLVLLACGSTSPPPEDDSVGLPDRVDPPDPVDSSPVADAGPKDTSVKDSPPDVITDADDGGDGLHVFVSSTTPHGNALGGQAGADGTCKSLAMAAGLGGNWVAWLSNNNGGPDAINRVTSAGPWRLVTSGEVVASTKAVLASGSLAHAIDRDEKGIVITAGRVWTGTGSNGLFLTNDCDKWTATGTNGRVGSTAATDGNWTSTGVDGCGNPRHLYCFQL
jgi:hypothetical protein